LLVHPNVVDNLDIDLDDMNIGLKALDGFMMALDLVEFDPDRL
jgi:hypothetical protein